MSRTVRLVGTPILICVSFIAVLCYLFFLYYPLDSKTKGSQQNRNVAVEQPVGEPITIEYARLNQDSKNYLVGKISEGIASATKKGIDDFCAKYKIIDEIDRNLIFSSSGAGSLLDSISTDMNNDNDVKSIVSIYEIKPCRKKGGIALSINNHFNFVLPKLNLTLQYKCLEANVDIPVALITLFQTRDGKLKKNIDLILYHLKDGTWKRLVEKNVIEGN